MRRTSSLLLGTLIAAIAICALTNAQSSPKRRTPVLTNDDVGSAPREVIGAAPESEVRPSNLAKPKEFHGPIEWHRDLRRAFETADSDGKLVIVDVYTDWCGWCKKMDQTIYSNERIAGLSKQQVFVKVNAEDRGQGQNFAEQMRVKGYPTTIVLDGKGRVLNVAEGYIASPQAFLELVQQAQATQAR
jgi:thiol:disulfide interchange protein